MINYNELYKKHSFLRNELSRRGVFICPICKNPVHVCDAVNYAKESDVSLTRTSYFGNAYYSEYTHTYHAYRVCKDCSKKNDRNEKIMFLVWLLVVLLFILAFTYFYWFIEEYWVSYSFFSITKNLEERSVWSWLGLIALFSFLSFLIYRFVATVLRNFMTSLQNVLFEEAFECNAIATKDADCVSKIYIPVYK